MKWVELFSGALSRQTGGNIYIYIYICLQIAALGGFILFFGFLAFNGGSQLAIQNEGDGAAISLAVVNTVISASFAAFSSLFINKIKIFGNASWSLLITINGALTGMVHCDFYFICTNVWGGAIVCIIVSYTKIKLNKD